MIRWVIILKVFQWKHSLFSHSSAEGGTFLWAHPEALFNASQLVWSQSWSSMKLDAYLEFIYFFVYLFICPLIFNCNILYSCRFVLCCKIFLTLAFVLVDVDSCLVSGLLTWLPWFVTPGGRNTCQVTVHPEGTLPKRCALLVKVRASELWVFPSFPILILTISLFSFNN